MDGGGPGLQHVPGRTLGKRLRDDAKLRMELAYCVPLGIPHSVFLGWDPDDQDMALAYRRYESLVCSCGTRQEEWERDSDAYIADVEVCPGCARIEQERGNDVAKVKGARIGLLPREIALRKMEQS